MADRFEIIPAIDLQGGRCVRLLQGQFGSETVYRDDPVQVALRWQEEGASRLHLVDLEGAKVGRPCQLEVVRAICCAVSIPVQLGGGIRCLEDANRALEVGVSRVVIGTAAVEDPTVARLIFEQLGARAALALDVWDDRVAIHGWQTQSKVDYLTFARQMARLGVQRIIFTNIRQDGTLSGAEIEPIARLLEVVSMPVIASGGVASVEDLLRLRSLQTQGLEGVIIGKALYEGKISLSEVLSSL